MYGIIMCKEHQKGKDYDTSTRKFGGGGGELRSTKTKLNISSEQLEKYLIAYIYLFSKSNNRHEKLMYLEDLLKIIESHFLNKEEANILRKTSTNGTIKKGYNLVLFDCINSILHSQSILANAIKIKNIIVDLKSKL